MCAKTDVLIWFCMCLALVHKPADGKAAKSSQPSASRHFAAVSSERSQLEGEESFHVRAQTGGNHLRCSLHRHFAAGRPQVTDGLAKI